MKVEAALKETQKRKELAMKNLNQEEFDYYFVVEIVLEIALYNKIGIESLTMMP